MKMLSLKRHMKSKTMSGNLGRPGPLRCQTVSRWESRCKAARVTVPPFRTGCSPTNYKAGDRCPRRPQQRQVHTERAAPRPRAHHSQRKVMLSTIAAVPVPWVTTRSESDGSVQNRCRGSNAQSAVADDTCGICDRPQPSPLPAEREKEESRTNHERPEPREPASRRSA